MSWRNLGNKSQISECWANFKAEVLKLCVRTTTYKVYKNAGFSAIKILIQ